MTRRILLVIAILTLPIGALADDGVLYYYGAPRLMHGESRIRMVSEVVSARVYRDHADVHCRFEFQNDGAATMARIGFPDGNDHDFEDDEPPTAHLKNFRSTVDGKPDALKIEINASPKSGPFHVFHVKSVRFALGQKHVIEDWYRAPLSGGGTNSIVTSPHGGQENLYVSQFTYIMASGGSWHGNIGGAVLQVEFMEKNFQNLRLVNQKAIGNPINSTTLARLTGNNVIWSGFVTPTASGNRLTFKRQNFKPTAKDDVSLTFDWLRFDDSIFGAVH